MSSNSSGFVTATSSSEDNRLNSGRASSSPRQRHHNTSSSPITSQSASPGREARQQSRHSTSSSPGTSQPARLGREARQQYAASTPQTRQGSMPRGQRRGERQQANVPVPSSSELSFREGSRRVSRPSHRSQSPSSSGAVAGAAEHRSGSAPSPDRSVSPLALSPWRLDPAPPGNTLEPIIKPLRILVEWDALELEELERNADFEDLITTALHCYKQLESELILIVSSLYDPVFREFLKELKRTGNETHRHLAGMILMASEPASAPQSGGLTAKWEDSAELRLLSLLFTLNFPCKITPRFTTEHYRTLLGYLEQTWKEQAISLDIIILLYYSRAFRQYVRSQVDHYAAHNRSQQMMLELALERTRLIRPRRHPPRSALQEIQHPGERQSILPRTRTGPTLAAENADPG